jgi:hypothetical protein
LSFANWDEIIDTCMNFSAKNLRTSTTSLSPIHMQAQAVHSMEHMHRELPNAEDSWIDEMYEYGLAHKYASIT